MRYAPPHKKAGRIDRIDGRPASAEGQGELGNIAAMPPAGKRPSENAFA